MKTSKFQNPFILAHIAALVLAVPLTVLLALTYAFTQFMPYRVVIWIIYIVLFVLSNLFAALALKRIGQSPFLALTGFLMGLFPLIIYAVLPDKSSPAA